MRCLLLLVPLVLALADARPVLGQAAAKPTTIKVTTREWSPRGGYRPLPGVKILVSRGGARVLPAGRAGGWVSDAGGHGTIEVASGEPVTLVFHMKADYVPELQSLAAAGGDTHEVGVALLTLDAHRQYENAHPAAVPAHRKASQVLRSLGGVKDPGKEVQEALKEVRVVHDKTRPRSASHPALAAPAKPAVLSASERGAVERCKGLIHLCGLPDGAIRLCAFGAPVRVEPYFANHAALALLAGRPSRGDLHRVQRWLVWYAGRVEEPVGIAPIHEGLLGKKIDKVKDVKKAYDSVDAYAATYLLAVARYHRATRTVPLPVRAAAVRSLQAIEDVQQADGLTIARPDYPVKFLLDNVEVYAGLVEGGKFFELIGREDEAERAYLAADRLARALRQFWQKDHFAWAIHQNEVTEGGVQKGREVLANLFGLAYLPPERPGPLWTTLHKAWKPDGGPAPAAPLERWLITARRTAPAGELTGWRKRAVAEALTFRFSADRDNVYVHRPAVMVLGLVDGPARFPAVLPSRE